MKKRCDKGICKIELKYTCNYDSTIKLCKKHLYGHSKMSGTHDIKKNTSKRTS